MKKVELVEALGEFLWFDSEKKKWLLRRLKPFPGYKRLDDIILYDWNHELVGREGVEAFLIKNGGKVYRLDYGETKITSGGRVVGSEEGISLPDALATSDAPLEEGDIVVVREYCFRNDRDYKDDFYYIKAEEIIDRVRERKRQIEEEQL